MGRFYRVRVTVATLALAVIFAAAFRIGGYTNPLAIPSPLICYPVQSTDAGAIPVTLTTQFGKFDAKVAHFVSFCLPADKKLEKPNAPKPVQKGDHLVCYELSFDEKDLKKQNVTATDQFGAHKLELDGGHIHICEPADKAKGGS